MEDLNDQPSVDEGQKVEDPMSEDQKTKEEIESLEWLISEQRKNAEVLEEYGLPIHPEMKTRMPILEQSLKDLKNKLKRD
ncbi:MAG: hypothetical protein WC385_03390 [Candidatus Paceibacterota bacterium]|jgi:polyhydroxyalkanoate synthesis regulator phasin